MNYDVNNKIYIGVSKENNEILDKTATRSYYDMDELVNDFVSEIINNLDEDGEPPGVCEIRIGGIADEEDNEFAEHIIGKFIEKVEDSNIRVERKKLVRMKVLTDIS